MKNVVQPEKKVYFISDFHLGTDAALSSRQREKKVINFLDCVLEERADLYILGDMLDFWFEYKHVVPKGQVRFFGKLCALRDADIKIEILTGNHDMWTFGYWEEELGIPVHTQAIRRTIQGKDLYMAHGDGLGPGDNKYKFIQKVFKSPLARALFRWIHPDIGISLARKWSISSRQSHGDVEFMGEKREALIQHSYEILKEEKVDYFLYGHRHIPTLLKLEHANATYCNLGDWISHFTFAVLRDGRLSLKSLHEK